MRKQPTHRPAKPFSSVSGIREGEQHFRLLADGIPHIVLTAEPDGWIDYCNQRWTTYTGLTLEQTQSGAWETVIHPDDLQGTSDNWRSSIASGCEYEIEFRLRRASDGAYRYHLARGAPFKDPDGQAVKWFATCTDIEDQKRAQTAAESANRAKSDFLSSMSHELRSPLNAILGFAQLMASDSPPPTSTQQGSIDQILKAGWHLLELINEVLDLAKIEAGQASLSPEPVSLAEALRECQAMIEQQALKRGIRMRFPLFDMPCFVRADRTRLKQILLNLLSNAIKYNRDNGTVEVGVTTGDCIRISVRDTGTGLAPERLAQLFQPFNRLGQEAGPEEGTGIGLVVAKRLVELMEGSISAQSTEGVGTVFRVELPASRPPELTDESVELAVPAKAQSENGPSVHTLLYVEDNPANLNLVEQLIARRADMRLLTAVTGTLGVEVARTSLPEVIVMDIHLPDINGIEALGLLREDPKTAHIPVIALSANAMPRDIEKGIRAGFFRYLTKPIKLNEFMEALSAALEQIKSGTAQSE
ncbi:PAS domain-containing hybrid sensor histidine kinase/response regulator [Cupriavidus consociatus]|uniref:PAS domain-containing hybrid sensor histidine kinase/response regulator n=1 Tax=Cupriavidus consociatus TaxID=2821357 RepID=UPI001AE891BA|nr:MULTISPECIES: PAS domain-containing hybrid sensor histidine kinase/response regulator [unclassified Cupriavidus]MBP0620999.1 response regulator [Cupriavidus sp. LEh25]MDK2657669.1 ATP-binding protein [Cupriavidus sp. LEh21]